MEYPSGPDKRQTPPTVIAPAPRQLPFSNILIILPFHSVRRLPSGPSGERFDYSAGLV